MIWPCVSPFPRCPISACGIEPRCASIAQEGGPIGTPTQRGCPLLRKRGEGGGKPPATPPRMQGNKHHSCITRSTQHAKDLLDKGTDELRPLEAVVGVGV